MWGRWLRFWASLTRAEAEVFFERVLQGVLRGERILLAAFDDSALIGTVQIVNATAPNQPHRAGIAKLLVHRSAHRGGQLACGKDPVYA